MHRPISLGWHLPVSEDCETRARGSVLGKRWWTMAAQPCPLFSASYDGFANLFNTRRHPSDATWLEREE